MAGRGSRGGRSSSSSTGSSNKAGKGAGGGKMGSQAADACAISFTTPLNGPDPAVVKSLKDGDILRVEVKPGKTYPSVVCIVPETEAIAGSLATAVDIPTLIDCIGKGNQYRAKVTGASKPPLVYVWRIRKPTS